MKRITLATFLFLLAGCQTPSSSIKTIQCEQRYIPDSFNLGWDKYKFGNDDRLILTRIMGKLLDLIYSGKNYIQKLFHGKENLLLLMGN